jgi:signal transduction histidine kinase
MSPDERPQIGLSDSANPFLLGSPARGGEAVHDAAAELPAVLVLATDGETRGRVHQRLEEEFETALTTTLEQALAELERRRFALALVDLRSSTWSTEEIIARLKAADSEMGVLVLCAGRQVKVWGEQVWQVPFDAPDIVKLAQDQVKTSLRRRGRSAVIGEMEGLIAFLQKELDTKDALADYGEASASMVHDLKNALFSTMGYTARLVQETAQLKDMVGDKAQPIDQIAKKLEHTSNYLLHLAHTCRYTDGKGGTASRERLNLRGEIEHVHSVLFFLSPKLHVLGAAEAWMRADRYELHRVFQNLFKNAFEAGAERVEVRLAVAARKIVVTVTDNGPGFPEALAADVFAKSLPSSKRGGQGIGLRICRQIVERHAGEIRLENQPGGGATFVIVLPES